MLGPFGKTWNTGLNNAVYCLYNLAWYIKTYLFCKPIPLLKHVSLKVILNTINNTLDIN